MKSKYIPQAKKFKPGPGQGRYVDPNNWITGPDPLRREKYYAWLKFLAQLRYRREQYDLPFEAWETLWSDELFLQRGKGRDNYCISRLDYDTPWCLDNCQIVTRLEHLQRNGEFRNG